MKLLNGLVRGWRGAAPALTAILILSAGVVSAAENKPMADVKPAKKAEHQKKFTGAELYAMHCNRCHPERYPTERTAPQWKTLLTHMRVRANLPAAQAKEILKYLQEDSGK